MKRLLNHHYEVDCNMRRLFAPSILWHVATAALVVFRDDFQTWPGLWTVAGNAHGGHGGLVLSPGSSVSTVDTFEWQFGTATLHVQLAADSELMVELVNEKSTVSAVVAAGPGASASQNVRVPASVTSVLELEWTTSGITVNGVTVPHGSHQGQSWFRLAAQGSQVLVFDLSITATSDTHVLRGCCAYNGLDAAILAKDKAETASASKMWIWIPIVCLIIVLFIACLCVGYWWRQKYRPSASRGTTSKSSRHKRLRL